MDFTDTHPERYTHKHTQVHIFRGREVYSDNNCLYSDADFERVLLKKKHIRLKVIFFVEQLKI